MKKFSLILAVSVFGLYILHAGPSPAGDDRACGFGKLSEPDGKEVDAKIYKNQQASKTSVSFSYRIFKKTENKKLEAAGGKGPVGAAVTKIFQRVLISNSEQAEFAGFVLCVQYFYREQGGELSGASPYTVKIFRLPPVPPVSKNILETQAVEYYSGLPGGACETQAILPEAKEPVTLKVNVEYAGAVFSVFQNSELIAQSSDRKDLLEKGFTSLTEELMAKYNTQGFVPAY
jgi:hypothetical protein